MIRSGRTTYDLRSLELARELEAMSSTPYGPLTFLDSEFKSIGCGPETVELCQAVATASLGRDACSRCPLRERARECTTVQERCQAGVWRTVAPILVHG